jgi:hypothetical protein
MLIPYNEKETSSFKYKSLSKSHTSTYSLVLQYFIIVKQIIYKYFFQTCS